MNHVKISFIGVMLLIVTASCTPSDALTAFRQSMGRIGRLTASVQTPTPTQLADAPIPPDAFQRYEGITESVSSEGYPQIGNPDAKAHITAYMSFDCDHCNDFHDTTFAKLLPRIRSGEVLFTYVPLYGTGQLPHGRDADVAALCASQQGKFWPYHEAVYAWSTQFSTEAFSSQRLRDGAQNIGLNLDQWDHCVADPLTGQLVDDADTKAFDRVGITGTPDIAVNGDLLASHDLQTIEDAIDQAIAGN